MVPRDRVDGPKTPDSTVKHLHESRAYTILTMENKRAVYFNQETKWLEAKEQVAGYLQSVPKEARPNSNLQIGLVGIGEYVWFYRQNNGGKTVNYPSCGKVALDIVMNAKEDSVGFQLKV